MTAAALCTGSARAQVQTFSTTVPVVAVPGSASTTLPGFDPAFGVLRWVEVQLLGLVSGSLSLENTTASTVAPGLCYVGANVSLSTAFLNFGGPANPAFESDAFPAPPSMTPFDGVLDFQGPSSTTWTFTGQAGTGGPLQTYVPIVGPSMAAFVGSPGAPGTVGFQIQTSDFFTAFVPSGVMTSYSITASALITVKYHYESLPAAICLPGGGAPCPCGTTLLFTDRGCPNSVSSGARLDVTGTASLTADSLVLQGASMPDGPVLYFQGDAYTLVGTTFGDGRLCVGGSVTRLAIRFNTGGASSYPGPGDPSISVLGGVAAPGDRYYQAYYRDAANFCTSATFNVANGFAVRWQP